MRGAVYFITTYIYIYPPPGPGAGAGYIAVYTIKWMYIYIILCIATHGGFFELGTRPREPQRVCILINNFNCDRRSLIDVL